MGWLRERNAVGEPAEIARHAASEATGSALAVTVSAVALVFSGYSLWDGSLKAADLHAFVPPVIQYAAPYQNSNVEVIAVPVTLTNEGARSATVLSMELTVTDPRTKQTKRFYAADFGRWTMAKTRAGAYEPFAPISLAGRTSRTESVLFYTRGQDEKPDELIREPGPYRFTLAFDLAENSARPTVSFERTLIAYDARAFNEGTLPLYSKDWRSSSNATRD